MTSEDHPEHEVLARWAARKLSREETFEVGWHLFLCAGCRAKLPEIGPEAEALFDRMFGGRRFTAAPGAYDGVTRAIAEKLRIAGLAIERERAAAPTLWAELEKQPPERRALLVENASRFNTYGLAELLLTECRRIWPDDPARAEELAELALTVTYRLERRIHGPALLNDLKAEAWAYIANCRRIRSDLRSVSEAFEIAGAFHARGTGDPGEEATLLDLKASYLRDQRRFEEALAAIDRVIEIHRRTGEAHLEGRALIKKATVCREMDRLEEAIVLLHEAAAKVDAEREPRVLLCLKNNLALFLGEAGNPLEARKMLREVRRLAVQTGTPVDRLRLLWTEGLISRRLHQDSMAEAALQRTMDGFVEAGSGYDAALVALDLAELYLATERFGEARELAARMLRIFASRDVHREALAALAVLHQAIERDAASVALVQEVARYLQLARRNPALRFEPER